MKRLRFPNGIKTIYIPFMLHNYSPWQEQIQEQTEKAKQRYGENKSSEYDFEITNSGALIIIKKVKV